MGQILNYNEEAEQIVLGTLIMNNDWLSACEIEESYFLQIDHKKIFSHIKTNSDNNLPANKISLREFFKELSCGDQYLSYLLSLADSLFMREAVKTLRELSLKRVISDISHEIKEMSCNASTNSQEIKEYTESRFEEVSIKKSDEPVSLAEAAKRAFSKGEVSSISSSFHSIDEIINGFDLGDLVILAGRPGMGKSCLAANIAVNLARENQPSLFISLEMKADQISKRIISNLSSIHLTKLKNNNITTQKEQENFSNAIKESEKLNITIDDRGNLTLAKLRFLIKKFVNKTGGKLVIIDYIQLIKHKTRGGRVDDITEITNTLKDLAMEFDIVILGLSQLSRAVEQRDDKRPQLSDLRDSGSLEQDASIVIFTFRPEYYLEREKEKFEEQNKSMDWLNKMQKLQGVAYAIVAKVRDGKTGEAKLKFEGQFQRFS